MSYRNAIPDIATGSIWLGVNGCQVTVLQAVARHVLIRREVMPELLHERDFRAAFEPIYDRERARQQFTMSLANLGEFRVFWSPGVRKVVARSTSCRREFRVPQDAVLVGRYRTPAKADAFLEDLDCVIEEISRGQHAAAIIGAAP